MHILDTISLNTHRCQQSKSNDDTEQRNDHIKNSSPLCAHCPNFIFNKHPFREKHHQTSEQPHSTVVQREWDKPLHLKRCFHQKNPWTTLINFSFYNNKFQPHKTKRGKKNLLFHTSAAKYRPKNFKTFTKNEAKASKEQCSFFQSEIQVHEINTSKQCHTM